MGEGGAVLLTFPGTTHQVILNRILPGMRGQHCRCQIICFGFFGSAGSRSTNSLLLQ